MDLLNTIPNRDYLKEAEKRTRLRVQDIFSIPNRDWECVVHLYIYLYIICYSILIKLKKFSCLYTVTV